MAWLLLETFTMPHEGAIFRLCYGLVVQSVLFRVQCSGSGMSCVVRDVLKVWYLLILVHPLQDVV